MAIPLRVAIRAGAGLFAFFVGSSMRSANAAIASQYFNDGRVQLGLGQAIRILGVMADLMDTQSRIRQGSSTVWQVYSEDNRIVFGFETVGLMSMGLAIGQASLLSEPVFVYDATLLASLLVLLTVGAQLLPLIRGQAENRQIQVGPGPAEPAVAPVAALAHSPTTAFAARPGQTGASEAASSANPVDAHRRRSKSGPFTLT